LQPPELQRRPAKQHLRRDLLLLLLLLFLQQACCS
jgi:hypothetical protein